jgi:transcriptional regulator with GAF, ATPase, and Fis domain
MSSPVAEAPSAALWRLRLTVKNGPDAGKSCTVDRDVVIVGKMPDCDLVLTDPTVSRRHLRIARDGADRWIVADLGSTNGTFVRGARIHEAPIEAGAVLRAGEVDLAFLPERQELDIPLWPEDRLGPLIGRSPAMRRLFALVVRTAKTEATLLIEGETGTGKGLVAKTIHHESLRQKAPYVVVDCGAVQRQLVESELFGHEKGAFTGAYQKRAGAFEIASGGTIFIDELAELPLDLQPKLLRVLDAREVRRIGSTATVPVDIRVICASRRDLSREVERGVFREDLYFRISVIVLRIPPLRERPEDIPLLVEAFMEEISRTRNVRAPRLDAETMDRLTSHDWPGNVRELRNTIERAVLLSTVRAGDKLEIAELSNPAHGSEKRVRAAELAFDPSLSFSESKEVWLERREKAYIEWLLVRNESNISAAAREARMDRKYLHKLIKKHNLDVAGSPILRE